MNGCLDHQLNAGYAGSSGKASLTPLRARNSEYTPQIVTLGRNDMESVTMNDARNLRLGTYTYNLRHHSTHPHYCMQVFEVDVLCTSSMRG